MCRKYSSFLTGYCNSPGCAHCHLTASHALSVNVVVSVTRSRTRNALRSFASTPRTRDCLAQLYTSRPIAREILAFGGTRDGLSISVSCAISSPLHRARLRLARTSCSCSDVSGSSLQARRRSRQALMGGLGVECVSPITPATRRTLSSQFYSQFSLVCGYKVLDERIMRWTSCAEGPRFVVACVTWLASCRVRGQFCATAVDFECRTRELDSCSLPRVSARNTLVMRPSSTSLLLDTRFVPAVEIFRVYSAEVSY
ncbi:hypothetical protein EXIGLDRAFT_300475 [Exidia glandulosa HHB12029]|uniref:Uncharacterized protein n=1 Tax=Exidia glandulosa HHB12029 TaxID=1314781 RepID=A0A165D8T9_EXIGL|nr:hypothetical protein EXIGLDRAFT_300475 [Exidia glandulosa HHB12029]